MKKSTRSLNEQSSQSMAHPIARSEADEFSAFFRRWLDHHQTLLDHLLPLLVPQPAPTTTNDCNLAAAISQFLLHYRCYFDEVKVLAGRDVFLLFSAPWLSPLERTLLWIGGFKPTLVDCGDLTADQARDVEELRAETKRKEGELEEAMARVHKSVAAPPLLGQRLWRASGLPMDGEASDVDTAVVELREGMRTAVEGADALRGATVRRLMEVLRPLQAARFLAAAAQFQLRVRRWGLQANSPGLGEAGDN